MDSEFDPSSENYKAGRMEGRTDVIALLRRLIDPENMFHWNADGVLRAVAALAGRSASETQATMHEAGYGEDWSTPMWNTATVVQVYGKYECAPTVLQAILIKTDAPVTYGDGRQTEYIYVVAARPRYRPDLVRAYYADRMGYVLWDIPLIEKQGTDIRMTLMDAGYDVSSWPKDIV